MRCKGFELLPWLAAGLVWIVSACQPEAPTGAVQLLGRLEQALSASDVTRVAVTVSAPDMAPLTTELVKTDGQWSGSLGRIPAGTARTFTAEAFGSDGTKLYAGQAPGIPITPGKTALVALTLQQVGAPPPFSNAVPVIDALVSSASGVSPGERVTLGATAHDPNASDSLTYTWTASAGVLGSASSPTTTWTAPEATGPVTLTVTVTDPHGSSATLSLSLTVRGARGSADLEVSLNTWPQVARIVATPSRVNVGESTRVVATATDNDGDALSYAWSATGCTGSWAEASSATARFTPDAMPPGGSCACRLEVTAADGRGGQARGTLAICVGAAATPLFAPEVVSTFQSATSVPAAGPVTLRVEAEDPQGSALGFTWVASTGTLGTPTSTANRSEVGWTAPACSSQDSATLTVTVRNAHGLTTSTGFTVRGIPNCLRSGKWSSVGSSSRGRMFHTATPLPSGQVLIVGGMYGPGDLLSEEVFDPETGLSTLVGPEGPASRRRYWHTATLLPSGKVLVVGGGGSNQVELFDSVSWTWAQGSSLAEARWGHTATLLPSGKVLVTGGAGPSGAPVAKVELYDPETGTWSPTAPLPAVRGFHTATLLPTGKVLVTGGEGENAIPLGTAELYDPETGTWAATGTMRLERVRHTATLLPSGRVLVTAGGASIEDAEVYDPQTETWASAGSLSTGGSLHAATLLPSGKVLVVGRDSAQLYDPGTGTWGPPRALETPHGIPTATLLPSGKVLVTAGEHSRLVELYDPESGGWTPYGSKDECSGLLKTLPSGKVLVLCGDDRARLHEPVTRSWSVTGSLHTARGEPSATLLPTGRVLVAGGSATDGTALATAELYDPETGTWSPTGAMSVPRVGHSALLLPSGKVLVLGDGSPVVEVYDPNEGTWGALGHLPPGRTSFSTVLLTTGKVLLVGGFSYQARGPVHHADVFDPETGTWALTSSMTGILLYPMATVLPSGKVLGLGLEGEWGSPRAEVYDPETGTWVLTSPMTWVLRYPTATVLPSGKVLVVGSGPPWAVAELYDPVTGSWVPAGELNTYFVRHTATRLSSGQVLVSGYGAGEGGFFTTMLLYNP